jgi:hypothetical protein
LISLFSLWKILDTFINSIAGLLFCDAFIPSATEEVKFFLLFLRCRVISPIVIHNRNSNANCPNRPSQNEFRKRVPIRLHQISVFAKLRRDESARQVRPLPMRNSDCGLWNGPGRNAQPQITLIAQILVLESKIPRLRARGGARGRFLKTISPCPAFRSSRDKWGLGVRQALFPMPTLGAPLSGAVSFPTPFSTASGVFGLVAGPSSALRTLDFE